MCPLRGYTGRTQDVRGTTHPVAECSANETDLSAEQSEAKQDPRLQAPDAHARGPRGVGAAPWQGTSAALCVSRPTRLAMVPIPRWHVGPSDRRVSVGPP